MAGFYYFHAGRPAWGIWGTWLIPGGAVAGGGELIFFRGNPNTQAKPQSKEPGQNRGSPRVLCVCLFCGAKQAKTSPARRLRTSNNSVLGVLEPEAW